MVLSPYPEDKRQEAGAWAGKRALSQLQISYNIISKSKYNANFFKIREDMQFFLYMFENKSSLEQFMEHVYPWNMQFSKKKLQIWKKKDKMFENIL